MTTVTSIAFAVQGIVFLAALAVFLRHQARERRAHDDAIAALAAQGQQTARRLIESIETEREARRDEIQALLQRVQAPEHAVMQYAADTGPEPQATYGLDDEEQATAQDARLMAQQTLEMIRQAEQDPTLNPLGVA